MKIAFSSGMGAVWGAYAPSVLESDDPKVTVGGGEAAMLNIAFALAARGHAVTVYYPGEDASYRDVTFRSQWVAYSQVGQPRRYDAVVSWSDQFVLKCCAPGVKRLFMQQLNDLHGPAGFLESIDVLVSPSITHLAFLQNYGRQQGRWRPGAVVPSGVDAARYAGAPPYAARRNVVSWWSSPDRGLHHLVLMWPAIRRAVPDAELHIFYHLDRFIRDLAENLFFGEVAWRARLLQQLRPTMTVANGVFIHGAVSRKELRRWQVQTKVLAMPFDPAVPTEGFGLSYLEGLAAGCYVIARPDDALPELFGDAIQWIPSAICDEAFRARFATAVVDALQASVNPYAEMASRVVSKFTWERAAEAMEAALQVWLPGEMVASHGGVGHGE